MKKTLLFSFAITSSLAFGQKKLVSSTYRYIDGNSNVVYIDSNKHNYNNWQGSLNEFKLKFDFTGDIMYFVQPEITDVPCDQVLRYSGSSYPLSLISTIQNTVVFNQITEANTDGNYRVLNTYDASGLKTVSKSQVDNSSVWETVDSTTYSYDALGNQLTRSFYQFTPSVVLDYTDTSWYQTGTNKLIKYKSYSLDWQSSTLIEDSKTDISWIGNNVQNCDLFFDNGSGLEWLYRVTYGYTGSNPTSFIAYNVANNTPTAYIYANGYFQYTAQNQIAEYLLTVAGDTIELNLYQYDSDGFLIKREEKQGIGTPGLFSIDENNYYFQNTAGIQELDKAKVSVYPNPATDHLTIQTEGNIQFVQILNLSGQVLLEQKIGELNIAHLASGTYFVTRNEQAKEISLLKSSRTKRKL